MFPVCPLCLWKKSAHVNFNIPIIFPFGLIISCLIHVKDIFGLTCNSSLGSSKTCCNMFNLLIYTCVNNTYYYFSVFISYFTSCRV